MAMNDEWVAEAVPGSVGGLRSAVIAFASQAGMPNPPLGDMRLAVSEALTNAVMHAYRHHEQAGDLRVSAVADGSGELVVRVRDYGTGFAPRPDSPGMGLGLPLMGALSKSMAIGSPADGAGTEIALMFRAPISD